jgi:8-oxo-dGTP pyrophosphatase MutT (NUDIX family)
MNAVEGGIIETVKRFSKLPRFPDGRIDYTNAEAAPVITVFVKSGNKVLLLKRSGKVGHYKGKWNAIAGYLDEERPAREKVLEELREEAGIPEKQVKSIGFGEPFANKDKAIKRTWLIHPVLVEVRDPSIRLDWEHTDYAWIKPQELTNYDHVPSLEKSLASALATLNK